MSLQLRAAEAEDVEEIAALLVAEGVGRPEGLAARVALGLARSPDTSFVAVAEGKLMGVILASYNGFHVFVSHVAIASARQRQGVGAALHERVVERGKALGAVGLITDSWLSSTGFYQRLGYRLPGAVFLIRDL